MTQLNYLGYVGSVEVSVEDNVIFGKLLYIRDLVTYEAETVGEIENAFRSAVDDYVADCEASGQSPDKPYKGSFNVRMTPELHRALATCALIEGSSLNDYVCKVLACHKRVEEDGQIKAVQSDVHLIVQNMVGHGGDLLRHPIYITRRNMEVKSSLQAFDKPNISIVRSNKTARVQ